MPKQYKGRKARKNPIQGAIDIFKRDGQNKVCNQRISGLTFGGSFLTIDERSSDEIEIFDLSHCAKYLNNIAVFLEAAQEMLRLEGIDLRYAAIEFIKNPKKAIEDQIQVRNQQFFNQQLSLRVLVYDLAFFTTKANFMLFLMKIGIVLDRPDLPVLFDTRYEKLGDYKDQVKTMRVGIDKYITWVGKAPKVNLSAETKQAVSDIELSDNVLKDSNSSPEQVAIADAMKESAEDTLITNAINHPENQAVVEAVIESVPQETIEDAVEEAQQEVEEIQQQNAQIQRSSASRQEKDESADLTEDAVENVQLAFAFAQATPPPQVQTQVQTPPSTIVTKSSGKESFSFSQDNFDMTPAVRIGSGNNKNLEKIAKSLRNRLAEFIDYESIDGVIFYNVVLGNTTSADVNGDVVTVTVTNTSSIEDAIEALAYAIVPLYEENSFKFNMDGYTLTDTLIHVYDYA